jgi:hypothetical protein
MLEHLQVQLKLRKFTGLIETASSLPWCCFYAFHRLWMATAQPNLLGFSLAVKDTNVFAIYVIFAVIVVSLA